MYRICGGQSGTETRFSFSEHFCFYLSASFYHCSTLIFVYTLLLPVGQREAGNFPKSDFLSKSEKLWIENYLNIFQSSKDSYICVFFWGGGGVGKLFSRWTTISPWRKTCCVTALYAFNQILYKPVLKTFCRLYITQGTLIFQNTRPGVNKSPVPGRQGEKICIVVPDICGSLVWYLFHVTSLRPRILWWLLDFCKTSAPLCWKIGDVPESWL